ncbi:MAG: DUF4105 domain-containing protein [Bacteroidales bacterium]|jgi:hypothetical protein|nr:DUF4105 domain-containing protein [Bacteroidales bacterium]MDD3272964.1 DUF4105 domain-containing protein [Bacteroidales bacterium]MDD4057496.1 DUF4105 domain-containing protein [Bacteroidales bacterium]
MVRNRFRLFSLLVIALLSFSGSLKATKYENSKISLITCTAGSELYSTFGHSALRVKDDSLAMDIVFNFGLFDFNTPNFYLKFIQGKLNYMLGIQNTADFLWQYSYEGRGVYEQELDLSPLQKSELIEKLTFLYKPENRYYLYSFLFKNCTTELRDLLNPYIAFPEGLESENFRDLINSYVKETKWTRAGINLILGSNLDREISLWEGMFLPDKLFDGLKSITKENKLLTKNDEIQPKNTPFLLSPIFFSILILSLLLLSRFFKSLRFIQFAALLFYALLGITLLGIIILTDHIELHSNYNLLWCNPLYALLLGLIPFSTKVARFLRLLIILLMAFSLSSLVIWLNGIQGFLPEYIIIVASQIVMLGGLRAIVNDKILQQ